MICDCRIQNSEHTTQKPSLASLTTGQQPDYGLVELGAIIYDTGTSDCVAWWCLQLSLQLPTACNLMNGTELKPTISSSKSTAWHGPSTGADALRGSIWPLQQQEAGHIWLLYNRRRLICGDEALHMTSLASLTSNHTVYSCLTSS